MSKSESKASMFQVGDRVVVVTGNKYNITDKDSKGIVLEITESTYDLCVEFDYTTGEGIELPFTIAIQSVDAEIDPISRSPLWEALK